MSKTLYSLAVISLLLGFSGNALAHSGVSYSVNAHSIIHIIINISVGLAFIVAFVLLKRVSKDNKHCAKQLIEAPTKRSAK